MRKAGLVETVAGHPVSQALATYGATIATGVHPAVALLPVLASSGAAALMQKRVEAAITELNSQLANKTEQLASLSDAQFKLICELMATLQRTNDEQKLEYLKTVVLNGVRATNLTNEKAYIVSRIIRDISVLEIDFLLVAAKHSRIHAVPSEQDGSLAIREPAAYTVENNTVNLTMISALRSLGLITEDDAWKEGYVLTPIAFTLLAVLQ